MEKEYDLVVLGAGSGGLAAAREAARFGKSVALVEPSRLGGTCLNWGCVPKKIFWFRCRRWLVEGPAKGQEFDWEVFKRLRDEYIRKLNVHYEHRLIDERVEWIKAKGKFIGKSLVALEKVTLADFRVKFGTCTEQTETKVKGDCEFDSFELKPKEETESDSPKSKSSKNPLLNLAGQLRFKHAIIATGSHAFIPTDVPGALKYGKTSNDLFLLEHQPKRAVVIGFGYIGIEITHILSTLGTETWFVGRSHFPLAGRFERELGEISLEYLKEFPNCHVISNSIVKEVHERSVTLETPFVTLEDIDFILFATGRMPTIKELALEKAEIQLNANAVKVNEFHQTTNPLVFAVGDVTGRMMLTPVAIAAARSVARQLYTENAPLFTYSNIPTVVFSHPPIAAIGLTEEEAKKQLKGEIRTYTSSFTPMQNAIEQKKAKSFVKVITSGSSNEEKVIGLHLAGEGVDEAIQGFALAMTMGATKADFLRTVLIHPSAAEEILLALSH
jgi:glutathione reductase (NADPH)